MSAALAAAVGEALGRDVARLVAIAGGDLNDAYRAELEGGAFAFVKTRADAAPGAFAAEAAGLRWLGETGALGVPEVLAVADAPGAARFLALAWIDEGAPGTGADEALGRGLAALHGAGAVAFGDTGPGTPAGADDPAPPTRLGPLALANHPAQSWAEFYGRSRIEPLARAADERDALPPGTLAAIGRLLERLDDLCGPPEPPARLHGDLWSGNVMHGSDGRPLLIDPAAYGGHREVDLAMLALFGGSRERVRAAYEEVHPLGSGHEDRVALYQLLPLLVHAVLFGGGYGASAARAVARYV